MELMDIPVHALQVLDALAVSTLQLGAVGKNGGMGAMLTTDANEIDPWELDQFQQDVVDGRMSVAGQQHRLAQQDGQSDQGHNQRRFPGAGQSVDEAIVFGGQSFEDGPLLQLVERFQDRLAHLDDRFGQPRFEGGRPAVDDELAQFPRALVVGHQTAQIRVE